LLFKGGSRIKILVTGGAGFIGSHLVGRLLGMDHEVTVIDNLHSGSKANIEIFEGKKNFKFIEHDVQMPYKLSTDYIFNLACPASPVHYQLDPVATIRTNVLGAINALDLAAIEQCPIFQASTSEVYGDPLVSPQTENYWGNVNPIGIRACYDEGKRVAETLFFDYARQYRTNIRVARIFNTYGPNMRIDDGRVVSNFIVQALKGEELTIYGDGLQTRSFCYVDDLVNALVAFLGYPDNVLGPINLGNPYEFTMLELASKIIEMTGSKSGIKFEKLPQDDPKQRKPDISLAEETLGWSPTVTLDIGLTKTIKYFADMLL